jgi:GNAT superfamily N-acetyltransferase
LTIQRIRISDLEAFIQSAQWCGMPVVPISSLRARSYLHNPHARPDDHVIYLAMSDGELVGFRSIVPDLMHQPDNDLRVAWLSGVWVTAAFRRKGIARRLLEAVQEDWGDHLLSTNQAPVSLKLLSSTGRFGVAAQFEGVRYYSRLSVSQLLPHRFPVLERMRPLLGVADSVINWWHNRRRRHGLHDIQPPLAIELTALDPSDISFIREIHGEGLFRQTPDAWQWIISFPWADRKEESRMESARYPFTCWAPDFSAGPIRLVDRSGERIAIIWLLRKNGQARVPYLWMKTGAEKAVAAFLIAWMGNEGVSTLTVFHPALISTLESARSPFLWKKRQSAMIWAGAELLHTDGIDWRNLEYGDGDMLFV